MKLTAASQHPVGKVRSKRDSQLKLRFRTWGGGNRGAGRKPRSGRGHVPHRARPALDENHPVHITMRAARHLPSLRKQTIFLAIRDALAQTWRRWFRVVHFSVQTDHVHLMVEASDKVSLSRGMAGLSIRLARNINRVARRKGRVFGDRYHARSLSSPREVRHALVYVLLNRRKHALAGRAMRRASAEGALDPLSSGYWFDGWKVPPRPPDPEEWGRVNEIPVRAPRTWLARVGWRRHGLIAAHERPA